MEYASKSVYPRPLSGENNLGRPLDRRNLKEAPYKGGDPSLKEGDKTPTPLDPTS